MICPRSICRSIDLGKEAESYERSNDEWCAANPASRSPRLRHFEEQIDKELLVIPPGTLPPFFVSAESKGSYPLAPELSVDSKGSYF